MRFVNADIRNRIRKRMAESTESGGFWIRVFAQ